MVCEQSVCDNHRVTKSDLDQLSMRWLAGWSAVTGHPWSIGNDVVRIEALMSSRRFEYLLVEPNQSQFDVVTDLIGGDSRDVVTVFTEQPQRYLTQHRALVTDRDDETLMTSRLVDLESTVPVGYETHWDVDDDRVNLQVVAGGTLAATGNVAVVGDAATFDRIETMPRYQRKGLGRFVMQALTGWAIEHGAEVGILAASADGQGLYTSLGWQHECAMLMFRGTPERTLAPTPGA